MIRKEQMIDFCRYYDGKKRTSLTGDAAAFWNCERSWIKFTQNKSSLLGDMLKAYVDAGLRTFEQYDNTPVTLKALLFNRYEYMLTGSVDGFKKWYKENYLKKQN